MSDGADKPEGHGKSHKHKGGHGHGGGGHEEAHEGAPEWLISFADMVMLMMGFFVILFALNAVPAGRNPGGASDDRSLQDTGMSSDVIDFAIAVREAFNNPVNMASKRAEDQPLIERLKKRSGKGENPDQGISGREQESQSIRPTEYTAISGNVAFGENSAEILQNGASTIKQVAEKMRGLRLIVEVRGHVSSLEAAKGAEHAMQLSSDRAQAVAKALAAEGVDWWQLRLVLCSDHDRLSAHPNSKSADQANSRVEIIMTNEVIADRIPTRYE